MTRPDHPAPAANDDRRRSFIEEIIEGDVAAGKNDGREQQRIGRAQFVFAGQLTPGVRNRVLRAKSQVRGQDFIGLSRDSFADSVGQKPDSSQRRNRKNHGSEQHQNLSGA